MCISALTHQDSTLRTTSSIRSHCNYVSIIKGSQTGTYWRSTSKLELMRGSRRSSRSSRHSRLAGPQRSCPHPGYLELGKRPRRTLVSRIWKPSWDTRRPSINRGKKTTDWRCVERRLDQQRSDLLDFANTLEGSLLDFPRDRSGSRYYAR